MTIEKMIKKHIKTDFGIEANMKLLEWPPQRSNRNPVENL